MTTAMQVNYESGKNYILTTHSCVFMVEICYEGDCGSSKTMIKCMLEREFRALESGVERLDYGIIVYGTIIAMHITPKQVGKFIALEDSWSVINELLIDMDVVDINQCVKCRYGVEERAECIDRELQIEKYNPRSVIGRLDFDRRAEADGIVFND